MKKRVPKHTFYSPSKINLFLYVKSRRSDGFHDLFSLMQVVDLFDILEIDFSSIDTFSCSDPLLPMDEKNLVIRALNLFRQRTGCKSALKIHLEKNIPQEAGLAGGSGNAATLLWALNTLFQTHLTQKQLMEWAGELSSDAPFFFSKGRALIEGVGARVYEQNPVSIQQLFLVKLKEGLSTKTIFEKFVQKNNTPIDRLLLYHNDLEEPAFSLLPKLKVLMETLKEQNLGNIWMTGSGTTLVCERLPKFLPQEVQCFAVKTLYRVPDSWYQPSIAFDN